MYIRQTKPQLVHIERSIRKQNFFPITLTQFVQFCSLTDPKTCITEWQDQQILCSEALLLNSSHVPLICDDLILLADTFFNSINVKAGMFIS